MQIDKNSLLIQVVGNFSFCKQLAEFLTKDPNLYNLKLDGEQTGALVELQFTFCGFDKASKFLEGQNPDSFSVADLYKFHIVNAALLKALFSDKITLKEANHFYRRIPEIINLLLCGKINLTEIYELVSILEKIVNQLKQQLPE